MGSPISSNFCFLYHLCCFICCWDCNFINSFYFAVFNYNKIQFSSRISYIFYTFSKGISYIYLSDKIVALGYLFPKYFLAIASLAYPDALLAITSNPNELILHCCQEHTHKNSGYYLPILSDLGLYKFLYYCRNIKTIIIKSRFHILILL